MNPDGPDNEMAWRPILQGTKRSATYHTDEPGKRFWFAVRAIGSAGASGLSNAVTGYAF